MYCRARDPSIYQKPFSQRATSPSIPSIATIGGRRAAGISVGSCKWPRIFRTTTGSTIVASHPAAAAARAKGRPLHENGTSRSKAHALHRTREAQGEHATSEEVAELAFDEVREPRAVATSRDLGEERLEVIPDDGVGHRLLAGLLDVCRPSRDGEPVRRRLSATNVG